MSQSLLEYAAVHSALAQTIPSEILRATQAVIPLQQFTWNDRRFSHYNNLGYRFSI